MKEKSRTVPSVHRSSKGFTSLDRLPSSSMRPMRTSSPRRSPGPLTNRWIRPSTCSDQTVHMIPGTYSRTKFSRDLDVDLDENVPSPKTRLCSYPPCSSTTIQLSLPVRSSLVQCSRRSRSRADVDIHEGFDEDDEEFTLPTHPPITVTIQGQSSRSLIDCQHHGFHADQICSPDHVYLVNDEQRIHLDTASLRGASTIVTYFMDLLKPSDNKLAMKLFGSRKGVLKERLRQQRAGHCIIHPCSTFR